MASRSYRRNRSGQFAGAGAGTRVTMGRAGGFANASHRANVSNKRRSKALRRALVRKGVKIGVGLAAVAIVADVGNDRRVLGSTLYRSASKSTVKSQVIRTALRSV